MFLRIETFPTKQLIGMHLRMSLAENQTFTLWNNFMPRKKEIEHVVGNDLFSLQVFNSNSNQFDVQATFEKWAAVEVSELGEIPEAMDSILIPEGKYAVFLHKGPASEGYQTFQYIFGTWLPNSGYELDDRPHFEILGEKYKNNSIDSEEEVFIPIR